MRVPIANPGAGYSQFASEIDEAVSRVLKSGWYILGESCDRFEKAFAAYCDVPFCVGVANGTDAVELALRSVGVIAGDRVITVANTAVATVSAIERIGAVPVFVDVDPDSQTMSPASLATLLQRRDSTPAKAIVTVHLFGHPCDMTAILDLAKHYRIRVVEDCAQAHGARYHGQIVGGIGDVGAFSFYPTKNLGAIGDGGAIVTNDAATAERMRMLRQYGWRERYISEISGVNSRLDELQAAILEVKLRTLAIGNQRRREFASYYTNKLKSLPIRLPVEKEPECHHVYHQYVIRSLKRDALARHLKSVGIGSAVLYPIPIHQQPAYCERYRDIHLPVTESLAKEILSLPLYPELTDVQINEVCDSFFDFFDTLHDVDA